VRALAQRRLDMTDTTENTGTTDLTDPDARERLSAAFVRVMDRIVAQARRDLRARGVRRPDGSLYHDEDKATE
jgi:hypothetical protein